MYYYNDNYGRYQIIAEHEFDGKLYQWRQYDSSPKVKRLGGCYVNWCEDVRIKFYRNWYLRDKAFPKFVNDGGG